MTTFLSLRGRHDQSNLLIDRGLLCRSFLTLRNDKQNLKVFVQALGSGTFFVDKAVLNSVFYFF